MEATQPPTRIHPLMAGAAASVMLVSLLGVAASTGVLPNSHSAAPAVASLAATAPDTAAVPYAALRAQASSNYDQPSPLPVAVDIWAT